MPGGLLNLVSYGSQNVILNGNPSKTFFKCAYAKYTNFGLQKFRIDFDGLRNLRMTESSEFVFKVPRYADLLMDTYLVVNLPTIWSPIIPPIDCSAVWQPYEFKWIKDLGSQMIERIRFSAGGQIIQEFTGQYLYNMVERDFNNVKKDLYYKMTGNVAELNDPGNAGSRVNAYPNAYYTANPQGPDPSIRARKLYIPINIWFTLAAKMGFPLVSMQYNELHIEILLRPVNELFVIRDVEAQGGFYHQANFNNPYEQFYRFLQPPPDISLNTVSYQDKRTNWAADIHIISTYAFLDNDEVRLFAAKEQKYLIKEVYYHHHNNVTGSHRVDLYSLGMVANWMWFFQRSDVNLRNEWSNYSNWPYNYIPYDIIDPSGSAQWEVPGGPCAPVFPCLTFPTVDPSKEGDGTPTTILITPTFNIANTKDIMLKWALLLDGKYRENELDVGVLEYIEKYVRTSGNAPDGLYCYNFCLNTNPFDFQPSGGMNLSKFNNIQFEVVTIQPPLDPDAQVLTICDASGGIIGVNKPTWRIYDYNFDLTILEERYNVLTFTSGMAGLMYAR